MVVFPWWQHAADRAADAGVGRVQRGHLRRVRAPGEPRVVPRVPLLGRRLRRRDALRLQAALPGARLHEHRAQAHAQEIFLTLATYAYFY